MLVRVDRKAHYLATCQLDVILLCFSVSLSLELLFKRRVQPNYNYNKVKAQ